MDDDVAANRMFTGNCVRELNGLRISMQMLQGVDSTRTVHKWIDGIGGALGSQDAGQSWHPNPDKA